MSHSLVIELSDRTYEAIESRARQAGELPSRVAVTILEQQLDKSDTFAKPMTESEKQVARERFERRIGSVDLGFPIGSSNEEIDADLAHEYGDSHETT